MKVNAGDVGVTFYGCQRSDVGVIFHGCQRNDVGVTLVWMSTQ